MKERRARKERGTKNGANDIGNNPKRWEKKIRNVKNEIRKEFGVDVYRKVKTDALQRKEAAPETNSNRFMVTEVMPSARKNFNESMKKKGLVFEEPKGYKKAATKPMPREMAEPKQISSRTFPKSVMAQQLPSPKPFMPRRELSMAPVVQQSATIKPTKSEALTVTHHSLEDLLSILSKRLAAEQERAIHQPPTKANNVALVHATHGCRTTNFRDRLSAHTLIGVDILPTTAERNPLAHIIMAQHHDTTEEDNDEDTAEEEDDQESKIEVISVVSTPTRLSSVSVEQDEQEADDRKSENVLETKSNEIVDESTDASSIKDHSQRVESPPNQDTTTSDLMMNLVQMEAEVDNEAPQGQCQVDDSNVGQSAEEQEEYSDHFDEGQTSHGSDRLSTIPEGPESKTSAAEDSKSSNVATVVSNKGGGDSISVGNLSEPHSLHSEMELYPSAVPVTRESSYPYSLQEEVILQTEPQVIVTVQEADGVDSECFITARQEESIPDQQTALPASNQEPECPITPVNCVARPKLGKLATEDSKKGGKVLPASNQEPERPITPPRPMSSERTRSQSLATLDSSLELSQSDSSAKEALVKRKDAQTSTNVSAAEEEEQEEEQSSSFEQSQRLKTSSPSLIDDSATLMSATAFSELSEGQVIGDKFMAASSDGEIEVNKRLTTGAVDLSSSSSDAGSEFPPSLHLRRKEFSVRGSERREGEEEKDCPSWASSPPSSNDEGGLMTTEDSASVTKSEGEVPAQTSDDHA
jgi:hypothetical protein